MTVTTTRSFRQQLVDYLTPHYASNDKAHRIAHVIAVLDLALDINQNCQLKLDEQEIIVAALTHDLFAKFRASHHELIHTHLLHTDEWYMQDFSDEQRKRIACATREHRASWKGDFYSPLSELISSADRGAPNLEQQWVRSVAYGMGKLGFEQEYALKQAYEHMHNKIGRHGYARYPALYKLHFAKELEQMWTCIDNLQVGEFDHLIKEKELYA